MRKHLTRCNRLRCLQFAVWATQRPSTPTPQEIAAQMEISLAAARGYRADWLIANTPPPPNVKTLP